MRVGCVPKLRQALACNISRLVEALLPARPWIRWRPGAGAAAQAKERLTHKEAQKCSRVRKDALVKKQKN